MAPSHPHPSGATASGAQRLGTLRQNNICTQVCMGLVCLHYLMWCALGCVAYYVQWWLSSLGEVRHRSCCVTLLLHQYNTLGHITCE